MKRLQFRCVSTLILTFVGTARASEQLATPFYATMNGFVILSLSPQLPTLVGGLTWFPVQSLVIFTRVNGDSTTDVMKRFVVNENSKSVTITLQKTVLTFQVGSRDAVLSIPGHSPRRVQLSVPPRLISGDLSTMMVPLRDLARLLGFRIQWSSQLHRTAIEGAFFLSSAEQRYQETIIAGTPALSFELKNYGSVFTPKLLSPEVDWSVHFNVHDVAYTSPQHFLDAVLITELWRRNEALLDLLASTKLQIPQPPDTLSQFESCHRIDINNWQCRFQQAFLQPFKVQYVIARVLQLPSL